MVLPVGARIALPVLHSEENNNKRREKGRGEFSHLAQAMESRGAVKSSLISSQVILVPGCTRV